MRTLFFQADEHLLDEVVGLLPLIGEEVANGVDSLPLPLHKPLKVAFFLFLLFHRFRISFPLLELCFFLFTLEFHADLLIEFHLGHLHVRCEP